MACDEPVEDDRPLLGFEQAPRLPAELAVWPVEAEPHLTARALHRRTQAGQLVLGDNVRLLDVHVLAVLERSNRVLGMARVVRRDVNQVDLRVREDPLRIVGGVVSSVTARQRCSPRGVGVHGPTHYTAEVLSEKVGNGGVGEVAAADEPDMCVGSARRPQSYRVRVAGSHVVLAANLDGRATQAVEPRVASRLADSEEQWGPRVVHQAAIARSSTSAICLIGAASASSSAIHATARSARARRCWLPSAAHASITARNASGS